MAGRGKVFIIGFQKTGTTSTTRALRVLGYHLKSAVVPLNRALAAQPEDPYDTILQTLVRTARDMDGVQDSPVAFFYDALDAAFPGSRFVLTTRDVVSWLESYRRYFPDENNPLRRWMYGVDRLSGNEARYKSIYQAQHARIREYFADRPNDLLELDLTKGDGWYELVTFLGRDRVGPFPHKKASLPRS